jgi:NAD dependent epimerase/dehydratase family enzyme
LLGSTRAVPGKLVEAGFGYECPTVDEALAVVVGGS